MAMIRGLMVLAMGLCLAAPLQAQSLPDVLYASNGPAVRGLSYCRQVLSGQADRDRLARQDGFMASLDRFGSVDPMTAPDGERRFWRLKYSSATAGTGAVPENDALSIGVRRRGHDCEITILAVPTSERGRVPDVTLRILARLDQRVVPDPFSPFSPILLAGTGPGWHGTIRPADETFDARISFGPRNPAYVGAIWQIDRVSLELSRL